ncbi:hypothetical protein DPMN_052819 [Dreissena polymorpha]|uniref:Uncharacterized protein n=1 Tax=Dreissena polymorpha TaxID=45954 RepID=A0A9D4HQ72_DREPO|nr:hypothetical protein DPMN_052819 [Dreissena polymorpha]
MAVVQKDQGNSIKYIVFIRLTELGQQPEHACRDRVESHSQKIFMETPKNRQAEWYWPYEDSGFPTSPEEGRVWELHRAALLIKRVPSTLDPDVLSC